MQEDVVESFVMMFSQNIPDWFSLLSDDLGVSNPLTVFSCHHSFCANTTPVWEICHLYRSRSLPEQLLPWHRALSAGLDDGCVIWVDDVHGLPVWSIENLIAVFEKKGWNIPTLCSEAACTSLAHVLFDHVGPVCPKSGVRLFHKDGTPTCTALSVVWTLLRLGWLSPPLDLVFNGAQFPTSSWVNTILFHQDVKAERQVHHVLSHRFPQISCFEDPASEFSRTQR